MTAVREGDDADIVVIGAGPAGAAAVWRLAAADLSVLCLDRGHWREAEHFGFDDSGYGRRRARPSHENPNVRRGPDDYPVDDRDSPIKVSIGNAVGGGSLWWAAHIPRYRPEDFRVRSLDGVAEDWPIGYDDLRPYYDVAEPMMGLAAHPGDPAGPPRAGGTRALPSVGPAGRRLARAFDGLGWHWWPVDLALGPDGDHPLCCHVGPCEQGCPARQGASAAQSFMRPALAAGARLRTGARVTALEQGPDGRVVAALCATEAGTVRVRGRHFVLAANGIGTPRLLLLSASGRQPNGLANRSGLVGRHLMLHPHARVDGLFADALGTWAPGQKAGLVCLEFFATREGSGFPRGFKMQTSPCPAPAALAGPAAAGGPLPWGRRHHAAFAGRFDHVAGLTICIEDLPDPDNLVSLSGDLRDRDGAPAPRMSYRLSSDSRRNLDFAIARAGEALLAAGASTLATDPLKVQAGFHLMGTTRMGHDPETSVVDPFGRCHDVPNLSVVDSSVFVTGSAMNPTATSVAFALRTADHLAAVG